MDSANLLYYGDNLDILRRYIQDESVDLVYLDPPFKSDQNYNGLFAGLAGQMEEELKLNKEIIKQLAKIGFNLE